MWDFVLKMAIKVGETVLRRFGITNEPQIDVLSPFDRADANDRCWLHLRVEVKRKKWRGETKEVSGCLIELTFKRMDGTLLLQQQGMWAPDVPPYIETEATLREGDPSLRFSLVLRSLTEFRPPVQPKALVLPNKTYITGVEFLAHGYTTSQLEPGAYEVDVRLHSRGRTWSMTKWLLKNPDKGLDGFSLTPWQR